VIFGLAGSHVLPIYAVLRDTPAIRHVSVKHENSAALMADVYARITGKPGVVITTAGPGATNAITGIAQAYASGLPLVHICGTVPLGAGKEAFHGVDNPDFIQNLFRDITKSSVQVARAADIPAVFAEAFFVAQSGRPGPVHIDLPINLLGGSALEMAAYARREPERRSIPAPTLALMAEMIRRSKRPVLAVGKGVLAAHAEEELAALSRHLSAPVLFANRDAWGAIAEGEPYFAGTFSTMDVFDYPYPNRVLARADLVILVGERAGTDPSRAAHEHGGGPVIAINTESDPDEADQQAEIAVVADARLALAGLLDALKEDARPHDAALAASLRHYHQGLRREVYAQINASAAQAGQLHLGQFIEALTPFIDDDTIVIGDIGHHDLWSRVLMPIRNRDTYKPEGSWGAMGFAIPGAIGAKVAAPQKKVIGLTGDGCFMMSLADFGTAVEQGLPIVYAVINDQQYGMMWTMLETRFGGAYECANRPPDLVAFARAFGADGARVTTVAEIAPALERALASPVPFVLDIACGYKFPYPDYAAALAKLDASAPAVG
jgi:acetolactate synthase-1/2/3 large subunit